MKLSQTELKKILDYCPETGVFTWKTMKSRVVKTGDIAGFINELGYRVIRINRINFFAHRLAWLYMNGVFPTHFIDHKNQIRSDNSFENLREATDVQNMQNVKLSKKNTSGYKGVCFHIRRQKWIAQAKNNRKQVYLGYFDTPEKAYEAYKAYTEKLHGEFFCEAKAA